MCPLLVFGVQHEERLAIMDDRDYRSGSLNKEKRSHRGLWLGMLAVALILAIAFFSFERPLRETGAPNNTSQIEDNGANSPAAVEPAQGDAATTGTETTPNSTTTESNSPADATSPAMKTYATEDECTSATGKPCNFITCDAVPESTQPDEACGPDFQQGWQPVVPAPDQTNVPENVAPPLTGQGTETAPKPPLTGQ